VSISRVFCGDHDGPDTHAARYRPVSGYKIAQIRSEVHATSCGDRIGSNRENRPDELQPSTEPRAVTQELVSEAQEKITQSLYHWAATVPYRHEDIENSGCHCCGEVGEDGWGWEYSILLVVGCGRLSSIFRKMPFLNQAVLDTAMRK
jgi:hypothetical protein